VGLFDSIGQFFVRLFVRGVIPREPVVLRAVGVVRNGVREARARGWASRSRIAARPSSGEAFPAALGASDDFSTAAWVFREGVSAFSCADSSTAISKTMR